MLFPTATRLAASTQDEIARLGMPSSRARTLLAVATAVARGDIDLGPGGDVDATIARLTALPGIGPWTANYIAMRALRWPDAFLANDLVVLKAMHETRPARALARSEAWRPWRRVCRHALMERNVMKSSILIHRMSSPLGNMLLAAAGGALCGIYFAGQKHHPPEDPADVARRRPLAGFCNRVHSACRIFRRNACVFRAGRSRRREPRFQRAVWNAIATVPFGATITYAELAARAGHPGSARAVGAATGRNPLSIVVPCR